MVEPLVDQRSVTRTPSSSTTSSRWVLETVRVPSVIARSVPSAPSARRGLRPTSARPLTSATVPQSNVRCATTSGSNLSPRVVMSTVTSVWSSASRSSRSSGSSDASGAGGGTGAGVSGAGAAPSGWSGAPSIVTRVGTGARRSGAWPAAVAVGAVDGALFASQGWTWSVAGSRPATTSSSATSVAESYQVRRSPGRSRRTWTAARTQPTRRTDPSPARTNRSQVPPVPGAPAVRASTSRRPIAALPGERPVLAKETPTATRPTSVRAPRTPPTTTSGAVSCTSPTAVQAPAAPAGTERTTVSSAAAPARRPGAAGTHPPSAERDGTGETRRGGGGANDMTAAPSTTR